MTPEHLPVWFTTGCSSGFGRALATLVLEGGWRAAVTARDPSQVEGLVARHEGRGAAPTPDMQAGVVFRRSPPARAAQRVPCATRCRQTTALLRRMMTDAAAEILDELTCKRAECIFNPQAIGVRQAWS